MSKTLEQSVTAIEKRLAALEGVLHSDAQNSICGTAHTSPPPEMLYVNGSSGGQFDERALQLHGSEDVVSAIVENAPASSEECRDRGKHWFLT